MSRPPLPPFTEETAKQKVRMAEDGWNGRNPAKVALAYTPDIPAILGHAYLFLLRPSLAQWRQFAISVSAGPG